MQTIKTFAISRNLVPLLQDNFFDYVLDEPLISIVESANESKKDYLFFPVFADDDLGNSIIVSLEIFGSYLLVRTNEGFSKKAEKAFIADRQIFP